MTENSEIKDAKGGGKVKQDQGSSRNKKAQRVGVEQEQYLTPSEQMAHTEIRKVPPEAEGVYHLDHIPKPEPKPEDAEPKPEQKLTWYERQAYFLLFGVRPEDEKKPIYCLADIPVARRERVIRKAKELKNKADARTAKKLSQLPLNRKLEPKAKRAYEIVTLGKPEDDGVFTWGDIQDDEEKRQIVEIVAQLEADEGESEFFTQEEEPYPFKCLGYDRDYYYLFSHGKRLTYANSPADLCSKPKLIRLAPLEWWEQHFPNESDGISYDDVLTYIDSECQRLGIYSPELVRDIGFNFDGDRIVSHEGKLLIDVRDGSTIPMHDPNLECVYEISHFAHMPPVEPATPELIDEYLKYIDSIYWEHPSHGHILAGWIPSAAFCGLLKWRPHGWLTGPPGAGKSQCVLAFIDVCINKNRIFHCKGSITAAAIRQNLKAKSAIVMVDETESETPMGCKRLDEMNEVARNCSSDDVALAGQGTASGQAILYMQRYIFFNSSINPRLLLPSDKSRFTVLHIQKRDYTEESRQRFEWLTQTRKKFRKINMADRLEGLMRQRIDTFLANIETFSEAASYLFRDARKGIQHGTPLAGRRTLQSAEPISYDDAIAYIKEIGLLEAFPNEQGSNQSSWEDLWSLICAQRLKMLTSKSNLSVALAIDMLKKDDNDQEFAELLGTFVAPAHGSSLIADKAKKGRKEVKQALGQLGIIYQRKDENLYKQHQGEGIYLANQSVELKKALKGTAYEDWSEQVKRIGLTLKDGVKINGQSQRVRFVPAKYLNLA